MLLVSVDLVVNPIPSASRKMGGKKAPVKKSRKIMIMKPEEECAHFPDHYTFRLAQSLQPLVGLVTNHPSGQMKSVDLARADSQCFNVAYTDHTPITTRPLPSQRKFN